MLVSIKKPWTEPRQSSCSSPSSELSGDGRKIQYPILSAVQEQNTRYRPYLRHTSVGWSTQGWRDQTISIRLYILSACSPLLHMFTPVQKNTGLILSWLNLVKISNPFPLRILNLFFFYHIYIFIRYQSYKSLSTVPFKWPYRNRFYKRSDYFKMYHFFQVRFVVRKTF